jgi:hypothetical protein
MTVACVPSPGQTATPPAAADQAPAATLKLSWAKGTTVPGTVDNAVVAGDWIYAFGATGMARATFVAHIGPDGLPERWTTLPDVRPEFLATLAFVGDDRGAGWLVAAGGGCVYSGTVPTIAVARVPGDGSLGAWKKDPSTLTPPRCRAAPLVMGDAVMLVGGRYWSGGSYTGFGTGVPYVETFHVAPEGVIVDRARLPDLPAPGAWSAANLGDKVYAPVGPELWVADAPRGQIANPWRSAVPPSEEGRLLAVAGRLYSIVQHHEGSAPSAHTLLPSVARSESASGDLVAWDALDSLQLDGPVSTAVSSNSALYAFVWLSAGADVLVARPIVAAGSSVAAPGPPLHVEVYAGPAVNGGNFVVSWEPPAAVGRGAVRRYRIEAIADEQSASFETKAETGPNARSIGVTIEDGWRGRFRVTAVNSAGTAPSASSAQVTNPPAWRRLGLQPQGLFVAGGQPFLIQPDWTATIPLSIRSAEDFWGPVRTSGACGSCGPLVSPASAMASLAVDEKTSCIYSAGGWFLGSSYSQVWIRCAAADGFLGGPPAQGIPAQGISGQLPKPVVGAAAEILSRSFLVVVGGRSAFDATSQAQRDVWVAPIRPDYTLGAFAAASPLPAPVGRPVTASRGNRIYLVAPAFSPDRIFTADMNDVGALSPWQEAGAPLPHALAGAGAAISGDRLYVVAQEKTVLLGQLAPDGSVASWQTLRAPYGGSGVMSNLATDGRHLFRWGDWKDPVEVARLDQTTGQLLPW